MEAPGKATRRHEKILDAALRVFSRKGYRDAVVDDIASESDTSKGGIYFHFPGKQAIFLELLNRTAARLRRKIEETIVNEPHPIRRADEALLVVLRTFASHRAIARLFMIEALSAGKDFQLRLAEIHEEFAAIIKRELDEAVRQGYIQPLDTQIAASAWFGALNEVVMRWLLSNQPPRLYDAYESLRPLLIRSVGAEHLDRRLSFDEELRSRARATLARAVAAARRQRSPVLACLTVRCPDFDAYSVFRSAGGKRAVFWKRASAGITLAAIGEAFAHSQHGPGRFSESRSEWQRLLDQAVVDAGTAPFEAPLAFAGFSFKPSAVRPPDAARLPDGLLLVPRLLFATYGNESWLAASSLVRADTNIEAEIACLADEIDSALSPSAATVITAPERGLRRTSADDRLAWEGAVSAALADIHSGGVEKVVLARALRLDAGASIDVTAVLYRLDQKYPSCTVMAFSGPEGTFLAATPETLLRIQDGVVNVDCLAGSIARGRDQAEDDSLAATLLADPKERHEHKVVASAIEAVLAPRCFDVNIPAEPSLVSLANVHHLYTPISATALPGHDLFELVEGLHPTPATGGQPREAALELIDKYETFDRGWYAGACGWVDATGNGEFAVAIRSALVRDSEIEVYAGCGIVGESDPAREYDESTTKMQAVLRALETE
jgi:isochorismate synthase